MSNVMQRLNNYLYPIPEKTQLIIKIVAAEMGPEWTEEQIKEVGEVVTNIYKNRVKDIQKMIQADFDEYVNNRNVKKSS